jgi:hypothetical protein
MALSAYKNTSAFKPTMVSSTGRQELLHEQDEVQTETLVDDGIIGVQEDVQSEEEPTEEKINVENDENNGYENENNGYENNENENDGNEADDEAADDDYEDLEESIAAAPVNKLRGKNVNFENNQKFRQKKTVDMAAQPLDEPRKLVIGKGAVVKEHVEKQTVKLRRVSKVRGDKELTALRQETTKFARPSMAARGLYEPQASNRNLIGSTPYAFTATVSRMLVKEETN